MRGLIALVACLSGAAIGLGAALLAAKPAAPDNAAAPAPAVAAEAGAQAAPEAPVAEALAVAAAPSAPPAPPPTSPRAVALAAEADALLDNAQGRRAMLDAAGAKLNLAFAANKDEAVAHVVAARRHLLAGQTATDRYQPGAVAKAEQALARAVAIDPALARTYVLRAHINAATDRLDAAKADLAVAEGLGYDKPWLLTNRAAVHEKQGEAAAAAALYAQVVAQHGDNKRALAVAYSSLRRHHAERFERDAAESYYRRHLQLEPGNAAMRGKWAGELLYVFGDFDAAIGTAREALAIVRYAQARRTLALALYGKWAEVLVTQQKPAEAKPYFDEARRLLPDLDQAAQAGRDHVALQLVTLALTRSAELGVPNLRQPVVAR